MEPNIAPSGTEPATNVPKLRTSCDACLQVKVKCEKTGTACKRCASIGTSCQFSPSKRRGKPPASSRKTTNIPRASLSKSSSMSTDSSIRSTPLIYPRENSPSESMDSPNVVEDLDMFISPHDMDLSANPVFPDAFMSDKPFQGSSNDYNNNGAAMFTNPNSPPDGWGWDFVKSSFPSTDNLQWIDSFQNLPAPTTGQRHVSIAATPVPQRSNSTPQLDECKNQDCRTLALNALNSLYPNGVVHEDFVFPPSHLNSHRRHSGPNAPHTWAVETVQQILRCKCSQEEDVALSCMAIIYRTLNCFNIPVKSSTSSSPSRQSSCSSPVSSSLPSQLASGTAAPQWEQDTELVMQRVSILQEMRRVAQLFDSAAERKATMGQAEPGVHDILSILSKSLRARLSTAMRDVAEMSSSLATTYA